jgi:hypothetical protein
MSTTTPQPTTAIVAYGQAAGWLRTTAQTVERVAGELGILPAMKINGVAYFHERDVERIGDHLREQRSKQ